MLINLIPRGHDPHRGPRRSLVQQDPLLNVKIPPLWPLARQVQRAHRQHRAHDIVAREAHLDHVIAPEGPDARVRGEGGVGFCGEVVEELELEQREVVTANSAANGAAVWEEGGRGRGWVWVCI